LLAARLNAEGRADLVIVDRFGTGDKWRNIAKRDFVEIVPVDGLFAWFDGLARRSRRCFTSAPSRRRRSTTPM